MTAHDVVRQLAHDGVAESFVQPAGSRVERRRADEDVRRRTQYAPLRQTDERGAEAAAAAVVLDGDRLDVTDERALHDDDDEAGNVVGG